MRKKTILVVLFCLVFQVSCRVSPPAASETTLPDAAIESATPSSATAAPEPKTYLNETFGLSFNFPADWFGPEEYISGQSLRVEVGSERVYPYGSDPETRVDDGVNSYSIVLQYDKNSANSAWLENYQIVQQLKDGESWSGTRSQLIRVGAVSVGEFKGLEYIATLSASAQTEPVYIRQVILTDGDSNVLSIMGSPVNVELGGAPWREVYGQIDRANMKIFHELVDSLTLE